MFKYRSALEDYDKTGQDYSYKTEPIYREVEPMAYDDTTGEWINKSHHKKIILDGARNFYELIQSHKNEVDIYKILERCQIAEDKSLLLQRNVEYLDETAYPENAFDLINKINLLTDEQKKAINENKVNELVSDTIKKELIKQGLIKENTDVVKPQETTKETTNE